ncbi:MAG: ABC transporter permease [Oscillospiraceae bacterium]|nr:ABC transporter permease [Oscillospiraceae bacterium]
MINLAKRGLKLYFKDLGGVFFSLLGVIIIFCLFIFFIGDSITNGLEFIDNIDEIMNSWVVAGMLASASITTSMGAYALMVNDQANKIIKDFNSAPVSKVSITGGYLLTGYIISVLMSTVTLFIGELFIVLSGGHWLSMDSVLKVLGIVLISSFSSSAIVCFIISFIRSVSTYTTVSILLGTTIGFLVGAYVPIGNLPEAVQKVVQCCPNAHAASLFRKVLMNAPMERAGDTLSSAVQTTFEKTLGVVYYFGDNSISTNTSLIILTATGMVFYLLSILNLSLRKK